MDFRTSPLAYLPGFIVAVFVFAVGQVFANTIELDWTSTGFSSNHITITTGDEVDIANFDDTFDLQLTGAPAPNNFYADIPPSDGTSYYYVTWVYSGSGTFSLSDEFGHSVTVIVNPATPLSVAITAPTNNAVFTAPATFAITAVPAGGATPYAQVQFYAGTNPNGVAYNSPFSAAITNLAAGNYTISAVVTDHNSNKATNSIQVHVAPSQATLTGDWPTYGNSPAHTGYLPGKLNGLPFVLKWKSPMQYSQNSYGNVLSQAAIGGGRLFVSVGYYSSGISVRALDANTGQPLWTNWPGVVFLGPPTYDSGAVFVQQDNAANTSSYLSSFNAANGYTNWSAPYISQVYQHMAPAVASGRVFADTGYYHGLTGFDEAGGSQQWFVQLSGSDQWTPACYNGEVYTWLGSFTEWDPATGNANWTVTNGVSGAASSRTVAVANGRAYFIGDRLYCVNLATHTNGWSVSGGFNYTPAVANGIVYAISNKVVSAFTTNGVFVRQYDPNPGGYENISGPLIVTDDVLIATGAYGVYVFRLADGSVQQQISSYSGPPNYLYYGDTVTLANNILYVTSTDGYVYAYVPGSTTAITLTSAAKLGNGSFRFSFTNTPGATFTVWGSTNVALALSNWTKLSYVTNISAGQYQFTDTNAPATPHRFYRVSSP
jgi:PQQ-like domain/Bacterial Ig domain